MPKIPFSTRRYGRYYFRRRVRLLDGKDIHVIVPLSTCDGQEARERVAILTAQFDRVRRTVNAYFEQNQTLDADTIKGLFETELRNCLSKLIMELHDPARDPAARVREYRTMASAFDIAQRPGTGNELTEAQRRMLEAAGHDEMDVEWVACDLDRYCGKDTIADEMMALMAEGLGVEPTPAVVARMKHVHLQAMAETRRAAAALMETAKSAMAQVTTEREQLERDRNREAAQLALLVRAADDGNGLELRVSGATLSMAKSRMTHPEKTAYESRWSAGIVAIGRTLADALETVRRTLLRLADKEATLERERKEHQRSVDAHQEALRAHQDAVRDLDIRIANNNDAEKQIKQRLDTATEALNAAAAKDRQANAATLLQERWLTVISATASASDKVTIDDSGKVAVAPQLMASMPEPIRATIEKDAPDWARGVIQARHELAEARQQAEAAEADWKRKTEAVSAEQRRIEKSRKVLDAVVSGKWDVAITDGYMTMRHDSDTERRNVQRIPLADMEPSLLHAAQAFTHLSTTTDSVLELRESLKKERSALAKSQPERASQIEAEQRRTDDKVREVLRLPPGWGQGIGR
ncbi:hypothetical protein FHS52_002428 [Erythromicrobium ramosum]|uniref:Uncharacterized protein n=1 Tax=Erythrobacter ramosus TaxID=35811 RepID=A0A6I4UHV1_9SPHN|nr:hypothetical protein [Erythrobacter ramosus]MBB3776459.1 hypothetical protein [Erythrobacter ramosus]MXP38462.1 hypothetical protein [Erythrobacter ramosus]